MHFEIPDWLSLTVIVTIFVSAFLYARRQAERDERQEAAKGAAARKVFDQEPR